MKSDHVLHTHVMRREAVMTHRSRTLAHPVLEEWALMAYLVDDGRSRHHRIAEPLTCFRVRDRATTTLPPSGGALADMLDRTSVIAEVTPIFMRAYTDGRHMDAAEDGRCHGHPCFAD